MELDHVVIAVRDLSEAAGEVDRRFGLASIAGGRHAGWGTANRIVPLGETYLELVAVVDPDEAATSAFGRWVARAGPDPIAPLGWVVRTGDIEAVAERLELSVSSGSRPAGDGSLLQWQLAGIDESAAEPALPFFVQWGEGMRLPGRAEAVHPAGKVTIVRVEVTGDRGRVGEWLGGHQLPVTVSDGAAPRVTGVVLAGAAGEFRLEPEPSH